MAGFHSLHPRGSYHSKPALECYLGVLRVGTFSDVTFIVGPRKEKIPAHQIFLKVRSPVFEVMFSERWNQESNKEVVLEDVDPKIFKKFLQYIYADTLEAKVPEALKLLQIAHRYDVQLLVSKCEKLMGNQVALDNAVDVFQAARNYDKTKLMDKVGDFMAAWAKNQAGLTVEESLEDILPLIRFPAMTLNEFTTIVVPTGHLPQSTVVELLTYFGKDAETRKSMASTLKFITEQRQPVDSSFALYSRGFDDCKLKGEKHRSLEDSLEFEFSKFHETFGLFTALYTLFYPLPEIALSSISLYCPTLTGNSDEEMDATKTFTIFVDAKSTWYEGFQEVLVLRAINARAGTMTEVKFATEVPLDYRKHYRITVEENPGEGYRETKIYEVRDFGCIKRTISVAVGETEACLRDIINYRLRTSGERYSRAQLIYKLGLKEIS